MADSVERVMGKWPERGSLAETARSAGEEVIAILRDACQELSG